MIFSDHGNMLIKVWVLNKNSLLSSHTETGTAYSQYFVTRDGNLTSYVTTGGTCVKVEEVL